MIQVAEIIRRSAQGTSQPFLCRCTDGGLYWLKGRAVGVAELAAEWVGGTLARRFELPVPEFRAVEVPPMLVASSAREDIGDLGAGVAFGSRHVDDCMELTDSEANYLPADLRQRILLFDWYILNGDRTLDVEVPNPNLLWNPKLEELHVIDQGLAFLPGSWPLFWQAHAFRNQRGMWTEEFRRQWTPYLQDGYHRLDEICAGMPPVWHEELGTVGVPTE